MFFNKRFHKVFFRNQRYKCFLLIYLQNFRTYTEGLIVPLTSFSVHRGNIARICGMFLCKTARTSCLDSGWSSESGGRNNFCSYFNFIHVSFRSLKLNVVIFKHFIKNLGESGRGLSFEGALCSQMEFARVFPIDCITMRYSGLENFNTRLKRKHLIMIRLRTASRRDLVIELWIYASPNSDESPNIQCKSRFQDLMTPSQDLVIDSQHKNRYLYAYRIIVGNYNRKKDNLEEKLSEFINLAFDGALVNLLSWILSFRFAYPLD